jgi:hypothetical protein
MEKKENFRNEGQALIEFVLGLMVIFSFFFFFVRMSAIFAVANYIHYATFMSARAYSSGAGKIDDAEEAARRVLDASVTGKFKSILSAGEPEIGPGAIYEESPSKDFWNQGVVFPFKAKLTLHPFTPKGQAIEMDLASESWMPSNPTREECRNFQSKIKDLTGVSGVVVEWDNGY